MGLNQYEKLSRLVFTTGSSRFSVELIIFLLYSGAKAIPIQWKSYLEF